MVAMAGRGEGFDLKEIQNDYIPLSTMLRNVDDNEALEGDFMRRYCLLQRVS